MLARILADREELAKGFTTLYWRAPDSNHEVRTDPSNNALNIRDLFYIRPCLQLGGPVACRRSTIAWCRKA
jgi:hypothetical protein